MLSGWLYTSLSQNLLKCSPYLLLLWKFSVIFLFLSGNYGGALGANALSKGLEGNKSLRVPVHWLAILFLSVPLWWKLTCFIRIIIRLLRLYLVRFSLAISLTCWFVGFRSSKVVRSLLDAHVNCLASFFICCVCLFYEGFVTGLLLWRKTCLFGLIFPFLFPYSWALSWQQRFPL